MPSNYEDEEFYEEVREEEEGLNRKQTQSEIQSEINVEEDQKLKQQDEE